MLNFQMFIFCKSFSELNFFLFLNFSFRLPQLNSSLTDSDYLETASVTSNATVVIHSSQFKSMTPTVDDGLLLEDPTMTISNFLVFYTSGTTGPSKPFELSHQQVITNLMQIGLPVFGPPTMKDKFLLPLSVHHIFGFFSMYHALLNGCPVVLMGKYTPKSFLKALIDHKVSSVKSGYKKVGYKKRI